MKGFLPYILMVILVGGIGFNAAGQDLTWRQLKEITFEKKYDAEQELTFKIPQFSKTLGKLEGKTVSIQGYLIPVDVHSNYYVLSANPFSACYFCGNAGPETVMELHLGDSYSDLRMDQWITVEGILELNADDPYKLPYILRDAEITEIE